MAYCGKCGSLIGEEAVFCPKCGSLTNRADATVKEGGQQTTVQRNNAQNNQTNQAYNSQPSDQAPRNANIDNTGILIWSILTTIFCCLPLGIVGIVFSVNAKNAATYEEAEKKLKDAKMICIIGTVVGFVILLISFLSGLFEELMYY